MEKKDKNAQKLRLLYLAKILLEETDDEHPLTHAEIDEKLVKYGFKKTDRGTFADDMEQLSSFGSMSDCSGEYRGRYFCGFEVIKEKEGREYRYHIGSRTFELPELKTMVDSIQSSRFVSERKSQDLIEKLKSLASIYDAESLNQQVYVKERIKSDNSMNFMSVDEISKAIVNKKKISFLYFKNSAKRIGNKKGGTNIRIEKAYQHDKKEYIISPWNLISNNQNYYLVGTEDGISAKHYRVDRMTNVKVLDEASDLKLFKGVKLSDYAEKRFDMFDGPEETVLLRISDSMYPIIADKFGKNIEADIYDDKHLLVKVKVCISNQFLSWILSLGKEVRIEGPDEVLAKTRELILAEAKEYNIF